MLTTIKSETAYEGGQHVTAKLCITNEEDVKDLFLSEMDPEIEDGDEDDHLHIQRHREGNLIYINGKLVSRDIADAIINFLK